MTTETPNKSPSKALFWVGWSLTSLSIAALLMSGVMKLLKPEDVVKGFAHLGWPENLALWLGILEIVCTIIYAIPRTSILGAILLTGYLGGAIATHVRIGDPFFGPIIFGVVIWLGIYLRCGRLRAILPLRS